MDDREKKFWKVQQHPFQMSPSKDASNTSLMWSHPSYHFKESQQFLHLLFASLNHILSLRTISLLTTSPLTASLHTPGKEQQSRTRSGVRLTHRVSTACWLCSHPWGSLLSYKTGRTKFICRNLEVEAVSTQPLDTGMVLGRQLLVHMRHVRSPKKGREGGNLARRLRTEQRRNR